MQGRADIHGKGTVMAGTNSTRRGTTSVFLGSSDIFNSGQYNSVFTRRNRSSTSSPEECDECCLYCCCGIGALCGSFLCIRKMSRARRVQMLWLWMTILALAGGLVSNLVVFGYSKQSVSPTDMRIVQKDLSPYFCDRVTLDSNADFSAYRFDRTPQIDTYHFQHYENRETSYVEFDDYVKWRFYLLKGSSISFLSCADEDITLYVFKGLDNFQTWKESQSCDGCFYDQVDITSECSESRRVNYTLTTSSSDDFFFVYADGVDDMWIRADIKLARTLYDTSTASTECGDNVECTFDLDLHKHQVIIYHISDDFEIEKLSVAVTCHARLWFYMLAFCACPLVVGCILSVIVYMCFKEPDTPIMIRAPRRVLSRFPSERTPLLWETRTAAVTQPPQYEDVVRAATDDPPTYAQATGS